MALAQQTVTYDVAAAKIYPLTSDVLGGGSPVYGNGVVLQGIAAVTFDPQIVTAELKGDGGKVIAKHGRADRFNMSVTYGRLGLDAIAVLLGGAVVDSGVGAAEVQAWTLPGFNSLPYFRFEAQVTDLDNGVVDCHMIGWKCQIKSATFLDQKTDAFGQPKFDCEAISTLGSWQPPGATASVQQLATVALYAAATPLDA